MATSLLERLAALPPDARRRVFAGIPQADLEAWEAYDWLAKARPAQLPPPGDWVVWLIKAGRGYGKTLAGAQWLTRKAAALPRARFAIVGETAAEVRDVMVEGPSGLLACAETCFPARYEPSKRRVVWPNGTWATTFSGDRPDQLRGPNISAAWCLVGSTPILMADGTYHPIENIRPGERVQTRLGPRTVLKQALTSPADETYLLRIMDGRVIIGTGDHPVWVIGKGFTPLSCLKESDQLCVTPVSPGTAASGIFARAKIIIAGLSSSIAPSGKRLTALFQQARRFIMSMGTNMIIAWKTLRCLLIASIIDIIASILPRIDPAPYTCRCSHANVNAKNAYKSPRPAWAAAQSGTVRRAVLANFVQPAVWIKRVLDASQENHVSANSAENPIQPRNAFNGIVPSGVTSKPARHARMGNIRCLWLCAKSCVRSVRRALSRNAPMHDSAAGLVPSVITMSIATVQKLATLHPVYNLTIAGSHEFFANGILTHNCDELAKFQQPQETWDNLEFVLRSGAHPQVCVTTTPRPLPVLKQLLLDPQTVVTSGSTFDNALHLAPSFIDRIRTRYEGTRLGRQELYAELLDETEGALWTLARIDRDRRLRPAVLRQVCIGVDPPGGELTECGIVAVGVSVDDSELYVLDDASLVGKPEIWARAVLTLASRYPGCRVIAEANYGGLMVESTLQTLAKTHRVPLRVELVHASHAKQVRAEPVALLAEQGRLHHVGTFAALEDELTTWVPDMGAPSPNRLDALVHATTPLLPSAKPRAREGIW